MKIIIFTYLYPNSRNNTLGIFNLSRAKALSAMGHEVCVVAPISLNPYMKYLWPKPQLLKQAKVLKEQWGIPFEENLEGIQTYHPKWIKPPNKILFKYLADFMHLFMGKKINLIVMRFKPDLIVGTWLNPFAVYSKYIKKKFNVTYFALAEGSDIYTHPFNFGSLNYITKIINKYCDCTIAVAKSMEKHMLENTNLKNVHAIINGYDSNRFYKNKSAEKKSEPKLKIINVANFYHKKGQDILIKAIKLLKFPVELTFIGSGPFMDECKELVDKNNMNNLVTFAGKIQHSEILAYLQNSDLFCFPSRVEGLPAAPLEAMACGLPVVGSNIRGNNEIIIDGFNGFLCKPDSPDDLAEKITLAFNSRWNYDEISEWVKDNFSWNSWAKKLVEKYTSIKTKKEKLLQTVNQIV